MTRVTRCSGTKEAFLLPTPNSSELAPPGTILTWVWDLKPGGHQQHTLPGIRASIEAILGAVRRKDICHCEDEAEQPGHQDGQDDLKESKEKALSGQQRWRWLLAAHTPSYGLKNYTSAPTIVSTLLKNPLTDLLKAYSLNRITFRKSSFMQVKLL